MLFSAGLSWIIDGVPSPLHLVSVDPADACGIFRGPCVCQLGSTPVSCEQNQDDLGQQKCKKQLMI